MAQASTAALAGVLHDRIVALCLTHEARILQGLILLANTDPDPMAREDAARAQADLRRVLAVYRDMQDVVEQAALAVADDEEED